MEAPREASRARLAAAIAARRARRALASGDVSHEARVSVAPDVDEVHPRALVCSAAAASFPNPTKNLLSRGVRCVVTVGAELQLPISNYDVSAGNSPLRLDVAGHGALDVMAKPVVVPMAAEGTACPQWRQIVASAEVALQEELAAATSAAAAAGSSSVGHVGHVCVPVYHVHFALEDNPKAASVHNTRLSRLWPWAWELLDCFAGAGDPSGVVQAIVPVATEQSRALVHCAVGASRSISLVVSWLLVRGSGTSSLHSVLDQVKRRRAAARPHPSFLAELKRLDEAVCARERVRSLHREFSAAAHAAAREPAASPASMLRDNNETAPSMAQLVRVLRLDAGEVALRVEVVRVGRAHDGPGGTPLLEASTSAAVRLALVATGPGKCLRCCTPSDLSPFHVLVLSAAAAESLLAVWPLGGARHSAMLPTAVRLLRALGDVLPQSRLVAVHSPGSHTVAAWSSCDNDTARETSCGRLVLRAPLAEDCAAVALTAQETSIDDAALTGFVAGLTAALNRAETFTNQGAVVRLVEEAHLAEMLLGHPPCSMREFQQRLRQTAL